MQWYFAQNVFMWIFVVIQGSFATKKAQCNGWTLTAPEEGDFTCSPLGVTISMPGTRCTLKCNMGYQAVQDVVMCSESGGWVPTNSPQCAADSTMTLTIVLSIMGSISLLVCLGIQYGRTSRRCQGKRRKLEEEDAESGARKEVTDTSTYYGRVQRLRRKRRLQAERQKFKAAISGAGQTQKPVTKQPTQTKGEPKGKRGKKSIRTISKGIKFRGMSRENKKSRSKQKHRPKLIPSKKSRKRQQPQKTFSQCMRSVFCIICDSVSKSKEKHPNKRIPKAKAKEETKVFSISEDPPQKRRKISTESSESSVSSSSTSSDSSNNNVEEPEPPKTEDGKTPSSRPPKPPQKPPPPKFKPKELQPPPRPPAPVRIPERLRKKPSVNSDEGEESNSPKHTTSFKTLHGQQDSRNAVSSGYSSDTERHKRHRTHHETTKKSTASHSEKPIARSSKRRMEMLSPGDLEPEEVTGNPYENYPAALSYRQYQDFENDYRRTTGEYRPQYTNLKIIPIQTKKKEKPKDEENDCEEEEKKRNKEKTKSTIGGVKYIGIIGKGTETESDSDSEIEYTKRRARKYHQRYENPADRDRRRHIHDYDRRHNAPRDHKDDSLRTKRRSKRDRKKQIENEKIIDDGNRKKGKHEIKKPSENSHTTQKSGVREKGDNDKKSQVERSKNDHKHTRQGK